MSSTAKAVARRRGLLGWTAAACATLTLTACTGRTAEPGARSLTAPSAATEQTTPAHAIPATVESAETTRTAPRRDPEQTVSEASETFETRVVEFEEVVVHERVRVPQADTDIKGPFFETYGNPDRDQFRGVVMDACVLEDAFFERHQRFPDAAFGEPTPSQQAEIDRSMADTHCRAQVELGHPAPEFAWNRWFYLRLTGYEIRSFATREEAVAAYEAEAAAFEREYADTLPPDSVLHGFRNTQRPSFASSKEYVIRYSPVDEVRVLAGSVSVRDGVLRGFVRNWSRTLWAYGATVRVGDQVWRWPLSIQPGEVAPFEIERWDGPADLTPAEFDTTAEMSNDADLSRRFRFLPLFDSTYGPRGEFSGWLPAEIDSEIPGDAPLALTVGLHPPFTFDSHPSMRGALAPGVVERLKGYVAYVDPDGRVVDLSALTPFHAPSHSYRGRSSDHTPIVIDAYPPQVV